MLQISSDLIYFFLEEIKCFREDLNSFLKNSSENLLESKISFLERNKIFLERNLDTGNPPGYLGLLLVTLSNLLGYLGVAL